MNAPDLAWQVSDLGVGQGGLITITATLSDDFALLGTTVTNSVSITSTGDVTSTNNTASVSSNVISPVTLVITKVVEGPVPDTDWSFSGSRPIGSFTLPAAGGSTTLAPLLPETSYTIGKTVRAEYTPSVTCTDGISGTFSVTVTPGAGQTIGCTFTNTFIPSRTGTVSGTVVSQDSSGVDGAQADQVDAAIQGAQVTLSNGAGVVSVALVRTQSTDADGRYLFENVPVGTYSLTVAAQGYQTSDPLSVTVKEDATTVVETVVLQASARPRTLAPGRESTSTAGADIDWPDQSA